MFESVIDPLPKNLPLPLLGIIRFLRSPDPLPAFESLVRCVILFPRDSVSCYQSVHRSLPLYRGTGQGGDHSNRIAG